MAVAAVTGLSPKCGSAAGGNRVIIRGTDFDRPAVTAVHFGTTLVPPALFTVVDGTTIAATAPPGNNTVDVTVTSQVGTSRITAADVYYYIPSIVSVTPNSGNTANGSAANGIGVVITGLGFTGATTVHFGGATLTAPEHFTVDSDTRITISPGAIPAACARPAKVTVTTGGGTSAAALFSPASPLVLVPAQRTAADPRPGSPGGGPRPQRKAPKEVERAPTSNWPAVRSAVIHDALSLAVATGSYGLSFGALSAATGLSLSQTCALSLLMFTGASQFALVGVLGAGGSPIAGTITAVLIGTRNGLYGLRLSSLLDLRGLRKAVATQLVCDESNAMSIGRESARADRLGFWSTGIAVYVLWNLCTLAGALCAHGLSDPKVAGLDAAAPAAYLALLAPRMRSREAWIVAGTGAATSLGSAPFVPPGIPILLAAVVAAIVALGLAWSDRTPTRSDDSFGEVR